MKENVNISNLLLDVADYTRMMLYCDIAEVQNVDQI